MSQVLSEELSFSAPALPDGALIRRVQELARAESRLAALLVLHLAEFDARQLYLGEGCPSLFVYCTEVLRFSEQAAYNRIVAARLVRRFPVALKWLAKGTVHLAVLRLLAPVLTEENHVRLLESAQGKPKRFVESLVAEERVPNDRSESRIDEEEKLSPAHPAVSGDLFEFARRGEQGETSAGVGVEISPVPATPPGSIAIQSRPDFAETTDELSRRDTKTLNSHSDRKPTRPRITQLSRNAFRLQVTLNDETHRLLRQAQELLLHQVPRGDLSQVIHRALEKCVDDLLRRKCGIRPKRSAEGQANGGGKVGPSVGDIGKDSSREPAPRSGDCGSRISRRSRRRHIPADVRRAVWQRDGARCAYVSDSGRRCSDCGRLEFHHVTPHSRGGDESVENIQLRCRLCRFRHNEHYADYRIMPTEIVEATSWAGLVLGNAA